MDKALSILQVPLDEVLTDETHRSPSEGLRQSLDRFGLFEPIHLRAIPDGRYQLADGSRRLGAARQLGWKKIAALVEVPGADSPPKDLKAIVINTQRNNLKQLHVARHARRLLREGSFTQAELARQIGMSKSRLSRMLKVLDYPELEAAMEGEGLEFAAARAVAVLSQQARQEILAELRQIAAWEGKFPPVRQVEERVRQRQGSRPLPTIEPADLPLLLEELQSQQAPITVQVIRGKQNCLKVTLVVAEAEEARVPPGPTRGRAEDRARQVDRAA
jgi:ParB/RepB/Spo0J family partition protein